MLAEQLQCRIHESLLSAEDYSKLKIEDMVGSSVAASKNPIRNREDLHTLNLSRYHNGLSAEVLRAHPDSQCAVIGRLFGALDFLKAGQYHEACVSLEETMPLNPSRELDKIAKKKAIEALQILRDNGYCGKH